MQTSKLTQRKHGADQMSTTYAASVSQCFKVFLEEALSYRALWLVNPSFSLLLWGITLFISADRFWVI